jgi:ornithine decarboxylase
MAREHGTPVVLIEHDLIRLNCAEFKKHLPKVQPYYAVRANPAPEVIRTLQEAGAGFDVRSLSEFTLCYETIKHLAAGERRDFIRDKVIYTNPVKPKETLQALDPFKPLVTCDHPGEWEKIKQYAPHAGVVLRLRVPGSGSRGESAPGFGFDPGEAAELVEAASGMRLAVEGLSLPAGSHRISIHNLIRALNLAAEVIKLSRSRGRKIRLLDIGDGFPAAHDRPVKTFSELARRISAETDRLLPKDVQLLARPGRFLVASAGTALARVIGKTVQAGRTCYYIEDSVYQTFSGILSGGCAYRLRAFKRGPTEVCSVFGQTCDRSDIISLAEELPDLEIDDLLYCENTGAYSHAVPACFSSFPPPQVVHLKPAEQPVLRLRGAAAGRETAPALPRIKLEPETVNERFSRERRELVRQFEESTRLLPDADWSAEALRKWIRQQIETHGFFQLTDSEKQALDRHSYRARFPKSFRMGEVEAAIDAKAFVEQLRRWQDDTVEEIVKEFARGS